MLPRPLAFHGRERQLAWLGRQMDDVRASGRGRLLAIRGRRRVGKSRLVEEFARRTAAPYVFFASSKQPPERELELFVETTLASNLPQETGHLLAEIRPRTWEAALRLLASEARQAHPTILVLDEFPYLLEDDPSLDAALQKAWDRSLQRSPVLVILIGSDLAMMEALTGYGSALYYAMLLHQPRRREPGGQAMIRNPSA